jgi:hypothetical protein
VHAFFLRVQEGLGTWLKWRAPAQQAQGPEFKPSAAKKKKKRKEKEYTKDMKD